MQTESHRHNKDTAKYKHIHDNEKVSSTKFI